MNCDAAFDALTDPSRRDSAELRWHLDLCPRCRQMSQVLEPALELFDAPAGPPSSTEDSPADAGSREPFLTTEMLQLAEQTAAALRAAAPPARRPAPTPRRFAAHAAAAVVAALLVGFALVGFNVDSNTAAARDAAAQRAAAGCTWRVPLAESEPEKAEEARAVVLSCMACHLGSHLD